MKFLTLLFILTSLFLESLKESNLQGEDEKKEKEPSNLFFGMFDVLWKSWQTRSPREKSYQWKS